MVSFKAYLKIIIVKSLGEVRQQSKAAAQKEMI